MADHTRFKDLQEAQKKLDQLLQTETLKRAASEQKLLEQISGIDQKYEHVTHTLAEIKLHMLNLVPDPGSGEQSILGGYNSTTGGKSGPSHQYIHTPLPRIDFPRFDGVNPRAWILKCNSYFKLMPSISDSQRVHLATMHFDGKALSWFQNLNLGDIGITWKQFLEVVSARFEDLRVSNIIVEFNKLKQTGTYEEYVDRFEELRACLGLEDSSKFTEEYFIASFLSGLSDDLQNFINMFQPQTLDHTIDLGRKQIVTLDAISKRMGLDASFVQIQSPPFQRIDAATSQGSNTRSNNTFTKPMTKFLTAAEMSARREKGLCYNCDEPYIFGHRCKNRINYVMMTEAEEIHHAQVAADLEFQEVENNMLQDIEEVQISLNSIMGANGLTTMRVIGEVGNHELHILLDTGSTLSFLQEGTAKSLGCAVSDAKPLLVRVANGHKIISTKEATNFKWNVQGHEFQFSPRLLNIEGCDMILGGDWLRFCTPLELDYANMIFTVTLNGKRVKLKALSTDVDYKFVSSPVLNSLVHEEIKVASLLQTTAPITSMRNVWSVTSLASMSIALYRLVLSHTTLGSYIDYYKINATKLMVQNPNLLHEQQVKREFHKFIQMPELPEIDNGKNSKVEPLLLLDIRRLTQREDKVAQILIPWLQTRSKLPISEVLEFILRKSPPFDPCGQGSFRAGGIVMIHVGVKGDGDGVKKKGISDEVQFGKKRCRWIK